MDVQCEFEQKNCECGYKGIYAIIPTKAITTTKIKDISSVHNYMTLRTSNFVQ